MRDIPVGNGSLLVNFDDKYQIRDVYFPHVGQENHSEGFPFRSGIWVDGEFSWLHEDGWHRSLRYSQDTLVTDVTLEKKALDIRITCSDAVHPEKNIYVRRLLLTNLSQHDREVRFFLHHDFRIYENKVGDTAFFDPETHSLIHYKKHRYFLIDTDPHFDEFATGRKAFRHQEGTWRDAEDGRLQGGAITEGSVDSTIAVHFELEPNGTYEFHYWIAAAVSYADVAALNGFVLSERPESLLVSAETHWTDWLNAGKAISDELSGAVRDLYSRSLLIVRSQIDNGGAIIAANDHDVTDRATDHYSYLWPRDGAFVANAGDVAGFADIGRRFFELCSRIVHPSGYFLQKYNPDGSVGSGWHAYWDPHRKRELLPIQEDETALVIWALGEHLRLYPDRSFAEEMYSKHVLRCARFMTEYRDVETGLPKPSWNLWEDRRGVHTFTCAAVAAGLRAAAEIAGTLGHDSDGIEFQNASDEVVRGMREHLYSAEHGRFFRSLQANGDDELTPDPTIDASLFGVFYFDCFDVAHAMTAGTMAAVENSLLNNEAFGGVARFEGDGYMLESAGIAGNSWIICTLWLAEYYIAKAKTLDDLAPALAMIEWVAERALPSGVLPEQIDPVTGKHLSVSPLTWSHSTFVATVHSYSNKLALLRRS
ncbi:MAG: glycoside hydrolase family 15 protein [Acidobacteria bacterium]|nr:glycoside hydrolase family 15 protein [Acidobacteriota bacterium]